MLAKLRLQGMVLRVVIHGKDMVKVEVVAEVQVINQGVNSVMGVTPLNFAMLIKVLLQKGTDYELWVSAQIVHMASTKGTIVSFNTHAIIAQKVVFI